MPSSLLHLLGVGFIVTKEVVVGGWPVKEEVRSKPRTCGEGRMKEEGRLLPMLEDVKKEDSCGRARESGRARRG